ncbi:MAG: ABC transporter permease [Bacteroidetes bacterium]|nr:MAG: ABC transporter permease [Bacteroidota bacterium]
MSPFRLVIRSLKHYPRAAVATAAGIAITTAIIIGALVIGHSLTRSLEQIVHIRLGETTHTLTGGERLFTQELAQNLNRTDAIAAAPVLKTEAIASVQGTDARVGNVQVWGVNEAFAGVTQASGNTFQIGDGEMLISDNLSARLNVDTGDFLLLRMRGINPIPPNTPFVSDEGQTVTRRMQVTRIISKDELARFNLQSSQTAPHNIFVNIHWLNRVMELNGNANMALLSINDAEAEGEVFSRMQEIMRLEDMGLGLSDVDDGFKLTASRVFIDDYISAGISELFPAASPYLTYFANALIVGERETPYSFVTATNEMKGLDSPHDIIINQWLADDLNAQVGDSLLMRYYVVGPLRELEEFEEKFTIAGILSMQEAMPDSILMPHLPGLSDAGSCRDWDTGIPIDLDKIRQKDEDYWDDYRGTPKAWITLEKGQQLWQNRFGNLTNVLFSASEYDANEIQNLLINHLDPLRLEFQLNPVRQQGLEAARGGVDFGQLFAGLGMFIIISGLLLTALLLQYNLQRRQKQIELFASLGYSRGLIRRIVLWEASVSVVAGAVAGLILAVFYTKLVFAGLNRIWYDIVRTDVLQLHFGAWNITAGVLISILLGMLVVYWGTAKILNQTLRKKDFTRAGVAQSRLMTGVKIAAAVFSVVFILSLANAAFLSTGTGIFAWFAAGISMLIAIFLWMYYGLNFTRKAGLQPLSVNLLSWKNLTRNPVRSFTIAALLALGSFVIVVTAANQKDLAIDPADKTGGTGGFSYMAETTVPILKNLNLPDTRDDYGIPEEVEFVQFLTAFDDDASCHNLNRVANPRLLGVEPGKLNERFSFAARHSLLDRDNPWQSLEQEFEGFIPAIADQSVIQWGLGKKTGDTLFYINSDGDEIRLLLIGGLENSVLQGNVVISQKHFLQNFPSAGGSSVFLIETQEGNIQETEQELEFIFRDYGWDMVSTVDKLAGFNSVENTYLQIFFLLGAFGMLLGTVGLAVLIARSMLERSNETGMFRALGFGHRLILKIYFSEYFLLFMAGLLAGTLSGLVATMPSFLAGSQNISPGFLPAVLGIILLNGIFWIWLITRIMVKKPGLAMVVRE